MSRQGAAGPMTCPGCGYECSDLLKACSRCGAPIAAAGPVNAVGGQLHLRFEPECFAAGQAIAGRRLRRTPQGLGADRDVDFVEMLDDDAIEVGEEELDSALPAGDEGAPLFRIDDDLFEGIDPGAPDVPEAPPGSAASIRHRGQWAAADADLPGPAFELPDEGQRTPPAVDPIIDRDEEVPERYWAPEVAGLARRAVALLVDQSLLLATLWIFFLGAFLALRLNGFDTELFLATGGLRVSAVPFALLAAGLSLAFSVYFHRCRGCTPGKALVGIEVRTASGGSLSWGRATLRWLGAALGVACGGVGVGWALFEPRRRSWADLVSGTVVARAQRGRADKAARR